MKRTPLLRRTPLRRSSGAPIPSRVKELVRIRSGNQCEARSKLGTLVCSGWLHFHHLLPRSAGGKHTVENLAHVCSVHHRWIHANPERAMRLGLLRSRYEGRVA